VNRDSGFIFFENFVCNLRYSELSQAGVTSTDYFENYSCGLQKLSQIASGNYLDVKGEQNCANAWYNDYDHSSFGERAVTCGFFRPFIFSESQTLKLGQKLLFRAGFNVFNSIDGSDRLASGFSDNLKF
jgi:hypothetical protein